MKEKIIDVWVVVSETDNKVIKVINNAHDTCLTNEHVRATLTFNIPEKKIELTESDIINVFKAMGIGLSSERIQEFNNKLFGGK